MDAGLFGARLGLDEAYRFARGEEVMASSGQPARLGRPLDWLVIADHSDGMVFSMILRQANPASSSMTKAKRWYDGLQAGGESSAAAALDLIGTFSQGEINPEMMGEYSPGGKDLQIDLGEGGRCRRALQRPGLVHHPDRLRVDLAGRRCQPASQRDLP